MADATPPPAPLPVFSLQCHANVAMSAEFLGTLLRHCRDPITLTILDDGSLTPEDCDRFREALGPVRIISREEGDDLVIPRLAGRTKCLEYRKAHPLGVKLLDPALIAGGPFAFCDGDILFLRDFEKLDRRSEPAEDFVCMRDAGSCYAVPFLRRYLGKHRAPLADFINSGLFYCSPRSYDLDFIEWFLHSPGFSYVAWTAEQTVWAALAGRSASRYFDPAMVDFPEPRLNYKPGWVALHFISPIRYLTGEVAFMSHLRAEAAKLQAEGPVPLRTLPTISHSFYEHLYHRLNEKVRPSYIQVINAKGPQPVLGATGSLRG